MCEAWSFSSPSSTSALFSKVKVNRITKCMLKRVWATSPYQIVVAPASMVAMHCVECHGFHNEQM